jgi:hypothetical protein
MAPRPDTWTALLGNLLIAAAALLGAPLLGAGLLAPLGLLALAHALVAVAALHAALAIDGRALAALDLAAGGMALVVLAWSLSEALGIVLASAPGEPFWSMLGVSAPAPNEWAPMLVLAASVAALFGFGLAGVTHRRAARAGAASGALDRRFARHWLLVALIAGIVALGYGLPWQLERLGEAPWAALASALASALAWPAVWAVLLWAGLSGLLGWPGKMLDRPAPRRLRRDAEQAVAEVLDELPLAGHRLAVRMRDGRPHLHLIGLADDDTELDAESQDVLRARLYERLRVRYADLALDVHFTRDGVWADRSLCDAPTAASSAPEVASARTPQALQRD